MAVKTPVPYTPKVARLGLKKTHAGQGNKWMDATWMDGWMDEKSMDGV